MKQFIKEFMIALTVTWLCIQFLGCTNLQIDPQTALEAIQGVK